jgi:hypothetical protein
MSRSSLEESVGKKQPRNRALGGACWAKPDLGFGAVPSMTLVFLDLELYFGPESRPVSGANYLASMILVLMNESARSGPNAFYGLLLKPAGRANEQ